MYMFQKIIMYFVVLYGHMTVQVYSQKIFGSLYEPILMINKNKNSKYTFNYQEILVEAKDRCTKKTY